MIRKAITAASIAVVLGLAVVLGSTARVHAASTRTWAGPDGGSWSTPGNWTPSGAPANGDSLVFPDSNTVQTTHNDIVELTVASLTIDDQFLTIDGNRLGISSQLSATASDGAVTMDLPVILRGNVAVSIGSGTRLFMRQRLLPLGTIALDLNGHGLTRTGGNDMEFNGDITGAGSIDTGGTYFSIHVPVSYGGTVTVEPGTEAIVGRLGLPNDFCGSAENAHFELHTATLTATCAITIGSVGGTGTLSVFDSGSSIALRGQPAGFLNGNVTGDASANISCCDQGHQSFAGVSTFLGAFEVTNGRVTLAGATFPATSQFDVHDDGVLAGFGAFGDTILTGSQLDLGPVDGAFGFADFPFLQLSPDSTISFVIRGPIPTDGYTQVRIGNQLTIDGGTLDLTFDGFTPLVGQSMTLIKGAQALLDTFDGLPEGEVFAASGMQFKITYAGGAGGHDVIVTRQPDPPPPLDAHKVYVPLLARS